jgi:chemotaxis protein methyltransferase CheR
VNCVTRDAAYSPLKDQLIAETGLAFYRDRDALLAELIRERLAVLGLGGCAAYTEFLSDGEGGRAERDVLMEQLTIGETYFFRDEDQFAAIRDVIFPDILERKRFSRQLRIWCAGCANGAEPYSLAILLQRELADRIAGWQVGIDATDLNRSSLAQAAAGRFRAGALRSTSDEVKRECFSKDGLVWTIHPRYKEWISFRQMNLVESEFSTAFQAGADFDLVLCRNVMIYFSRPVNMRLIDQFHQSLGAGGWLVLGATEANMDIHKVFRSVNAAGTRLFQKLALPPWPGEVELAPPERQLAVLPGPPAEPMVAPSVREGTFSEPAPAAPLTDPATPGVEGLRQLADRGEWQKAAEYGERLLEKGGLNAEVHFYQALISEKLGIAGEPERSLRRALYLDRNFALAHYHLGIALKRSGHAGAAARSFGNVLKVLAALPDIAMVTAGPGVTVAGLKELARMHLGTGSAS